MGSGAARNDDCPCGSRLKYKRCCLPVHEAAVRAHRRGYPWGTDPSVPSNRIHDQIAADELDKAAIAVERYLRDYPDQPDGFWRRAQIAEARGRPEEALADLQRLRALTDALDRETPSAPEYRAWIAGELDRLSALIASTASNSEQPRGA